MGWYLMVPPTIPVEPKALADWTRIATYNTANDCVREFFKLHRSPNGEHDPVTETPVGARCAEKLSRDFRQYFGDVQQHYR